MPLGGFVEGTARVDETSRCSRTGWCVTLVGNVVVVLVSPVRIRLTQSYIKRRSTPVTLKSVERGGRSIDVTVADRPLKIGDVALRIPENLIVTLAQIFEDGDAGELLTTNKLSELAVLTLYLCYEKKKGQESEIYPFIKELDRQVRRRGCASPLLLAHSLTRSKKHRRPRAVPRAPRVPSSGGSRTWSCSPGPPSSRKSKSASTASTGNTKSSISCG